MQKVVINTCFGGFGLSESAQSYLRGMGVAAEEFDIPRDSPALVTTVEALGDAANGPYARLRIVEVPDDAEWEIAEYDGNEHVAEKHRTWG